jgi:trehalose 6-phosphate phosphatase
MRTTPHPPALPPPPPLRVDAVALFLDLDGTLAAIEPHPGAVGPDHRRNDMLVRLSGALHGRLAVVSGRALDDIDRILAGEVAAVAGVHGLDRRRADGVRVADVPSPQLVQARAAIEAALCPHPGLVVEDKGLAFAVHFRQAPELAAEVADVAAAVAASCGLLLQPGDMVVELRPPGHDKGDAIMAFMQEPPFQGFTPVFVGDDLTDENGFRAVERLGGAGVLVGRPRETGARFRLADVEAVMGWLGAAIAREPVL